jgi:hypothetical protein
MRFSLTSGLDQVISKMSHQKKRKTTTTTTTTTTENIWDWGKEPGNPLKSGELPFKSKQEMKAYYDEVHKNDPKLPPGKCCSDYLEMKVTTTDDGEFFKA